MTTRAFLGGKAGQDAVLRLAKAICRDLIQESVVEDGVRLGVLFQDQGGYPLQGAACHACLLVPETSCEARNTRLDRGLLTQTVLGGGFPLLG